MARGNLRRPVETDSRRAKAAWFGSGGVVYGAALTTEDLQECLSVSVMHDCHTGIDGQYNPQLLGAVNDTERATDFAPGVWLNPLLDPGNDLGAVIPESAFAAAEFDCSEFPHICKIEAPPNRSQMSSVCSTGMFGTNLIMPSSVGYGTRMRLDA